MYIYICTYTYIYTYIYIRIHLCHAQPKLAITVVRSTVSRSPAEEHLSCFLSRPTTAQNALQRTLLPDPKLNSQPGSLLDTILHFFITKH